MADSGQYECQGWNMGNSVNFPGFIPRDLSEKYDSTWNDEEDDHEDTTESIGNGVWVARRNEYAAEDTQTYRFFYKLTEDEIDEDVHDDSDSLNVQFYRDKIGFLPEGVYIEEFYKGWSDDYNSLEYVHSYIQWLFPIQVKGMNYLSQELTLKEIKIFRTDEEIKKRLLKSYKVMLGFYGIKLVNEETGELQRAENWNERFRNLNRNTHNNLRITRIIKCLGLLGFSHYQKPLVFFFLNETLVEGTLPRVKQSALDYFMFSVLNKAERKELIKFAFRHFEPKEKFVWCPRRVRNKFLKELKETASHKLTNGSDGGVSSDSTNQSDQSDQREQNKDQIRTSASEESSNENNLNSESRDDVNVSGGCQDAGNADMTDNHEGNDAPLGVDSQHDGHKDSTNEAEIPKGDANARNTDIPSSVENAPEKSDSNDSESPKALSDGDNFNSSTASNESTNENLTQTSNQSSISETVASETPILGGDSGTEQQDLENKQDESEHGNKIEFKSEQTDKESEEHDSTEGIQKSGSESAEDSIATLTSTNGDENSADCDADKNSSKYTSSPGEANASRRSFKSNEDGQQTCHQGDESDKEPEAVPNFTPDHPDKDGGSKCGLVPHCAVEGSENLQQSQTPQTKSPEPDENMKDPHEEHERQNQSDETINQMNDTPKASPCTTPETDEKKEDPVQLATEADASDTATSHSNESTEDKNTEYTRSEQGMGVSSEVYSSQGSPGKDTETGNDAKETPVEDCLRNGGSEQEEGVEDIESET